MRHLFSCIETPQEWEEPPIFTGSKQAVLSYFTLFSGYFAAALGTFYKLCICTSDLRRFLL
jgi:hypothetical protein